MRAELETALRRLKPERRVGHLARRSDTELPFAADAPDSGPSLLLDTCVYVDMLEGSLPPEVDRLLQSRNLVHLSVAIGELSHSFGRLDPKHRGTAEQLEALTQAIAAIRPHRLEAVTAAVMLEAGILAGLAFRLGGYRPGQEVPALNDAAIHLHAASRGFVVLTGNIRDFDILSQLQPAGRVLFYRASR